MSGQITTVDRQDIVFEDQCNELATYLEDHDFLYRDKSDTYIKTVCFGSLKITVSFLYKTRSIEVIVSYTNEKSNGNPEYMNSKDLKKIVEFIQEFDFEE